MLPADARSVEEQDRGRVVHCSSFRRLQGKTQVMGVHEGDFHRTRLTHSLEAAQIACGMRKTIEQSRDTPQQALQMLAPEALLQTACYIHDIGHPPFGHGGERALHQCMVERGGGGFESNAQNLRLITLLERFGQPGHGINPTRRSLLSCIKYYIAYSAYPEELRQQKPVKCYYDSEHELITDCLERCFGAAEAELVASARSDPSGNGKPSPQFMTLDASIMQIADDIAYAVHDLEDAIARDMINREHFRQYLESLPTTISNGQPGELQALLQRDRMEDWLFDQENHGNRKQIISQLVNLCVTSIRIVPVEQFEHPLLRYQASLPDDARKLVATCKKITADHVINNPVVHQLVQKGGFIIKRLFAALADEPNKLIPQWQQRLSLAKGDANRAVCDFIAGMTDSYAGRTYDRLYTPNFGNSSDNI